MRVVTNRAGSTASDVAPIVAPITIEVYGNTANAARCHSLVVGIHLYFNSVTVSIEK